MIDFENDPYGAAQQQALNQSMLQQYQLARLANMPNTQAYLANQPGIENSLGQYAGLAQAQQANAYYPGKLHYTAPIKKRSIWDRLRRRVFDRTELRNPRDRYLVMPVGSMKEETDDR